MKALVIAESSDAQKFLCAGVRSFADEVALVTIKGTPETGIADVAYDVELPEGEALENAFETVRDLYDELAPGVVFIEADVRLKIVGGLLAAHADTSIIVDVTSFEGEVAESMYFGGLAAKKQKSTASVKFYMLSGACFADVAASGTDTVNKLAFKAPANGLVVRGTKPVEQVGADVTKSKVVVGCGRGFAEESELDLARDFAAKVKGDLACSRPLSENNKWMARSLYLGVSGKQISPKVYFAVGISGQMQHMVGVSGSDVIVAINKDQNAPIFKQADYGIIGDLKKILPDMTAKL
ncbi:MAG: electron transfer flavoprotein subunit alpha/FixB family protein [Raoultibacter sp.]|jgi:electron transfer flavoprotein alpha subunit